MEKDTKEITASELTNPAFIKSVFNNYNDEERPLVLKEILQVAKEKGVLKKVEKEIEDVNNNLQITNNVCNILITDTKGKVEITIQNYQLVMENDKYIKNLFAYNEFSHSIVCYDNNKMRAWTDADDSILKSYIEEHYNIYNAIKYYDAFNTVAMKRKFHPIKNIIEQEKWDCVSRIDRFLIDILKCEDNDYMREVSRMIFYGGINRLYNPGCKFDYMPILVGKQGAYKSSMVNWLALDNAYYNDLSSIEGKDALENIQGVWICELSELLAMVRTKDVEAMKSFVSRTEDKFRPSYGRRTEVFPRQCLFIGTTNDYGFLSDKTGNRRYLPIEIGLKAGDLTGKIDYVKHYILECWREALFLYNLGKTYLDMSSECVKAAIEMQERMMEDDPRVGMVREYLSKKKIGDKFCCIEIFVNCFNGIRKNYNRQEAKEMARILDSMKTCSRLNTVAKFENYGVQKAWKKIKEDEELENLDIL